MRRKAHSPNLLRTKAETRLADSTSTEVPARSAEELLHELQVYQIELEMQNEALRQTQRELEESRDHYVDLYDFSPVGYLTLDQHGMIEKANFTACSLLGYERSKLLRKRFASLVEAEYCGRWNHLFLEMVQNQGSWTFDLALNRSDSGTFHAQLSCVHATQLDHLPVVRLTITDITALRKAEDAAQEWQQFIDSAHWGMSIGDLKDRIIKRANPAFARMHGYTQQELYCLNVDQLYAPESRGLIPRIREILSDTNGYTFECMRLRKDGSTFPAMIDMSTIRLGENRDIFIANVTDISVNKQLEAHTIEMQENLRATLDAIPDLLFEVGLDGRYYDYHTSHPELLTSLPAEIIGKTIHETLPAEPVNVIIQALHEANETGSSFGKQICLQLPQGDMWFELSISRKKNSLSKEPRFIVLSRDINERKRLEREVRERRNEMNELQKMHIAAMTTAALAHELNQPLLAIASYCEAASMLLATQSPDLDKIRQAVTGSERQAQRAGQAIRVMLELLSLKEFTAEILDLNTEILAALAAAKSEYEMLFHFELKLESGLPPVQVNRIHFHKVLLNLLSNSIEAMQEFNVKLPSILITVRTHKDGAVAQITISDNGPGFREEDVPRLFEPFFTSKDKGIGMGLAISRSLLESNGGQLWIDPEEGPGATFHLTLPFAS